MGQSQSGPQGPPGVGIKSAIIDKSGNMVLTMTDGTTQTVQVPPGPLGPQGVGIKTAAMDASGMLTLTMTDGTTQTVQVPAGPAGKPGAPGVGIKTAVMDSSGNLMLTMTDGTTLGPFMVKGAAGAQGLQGPAGTQGLQGLPGLQGIPGTSGVGIKTANMDGSGNLILTLTDGTTLGPFMVRGPPGPVTTVLQALPPATATVTGTQLSTGTTSTVPISVVASLQPTPTAPVAPIAPPIGTVVYYNYLTGTGNYPALCSPGDNSTIQYTGKIASIDANGNATVNWNSAITIDSTGHQKPTSSCAWSLASNSDPGWQATFIGTGGKAPTYLSNFPNTIPLSQLKW